MSNDAEKLAGVARVSVAGTLSELNAISPSRTDADSKPIETEEPAPAKPRTRRAGTIHLKH